MTTTASQSPAAGRPPPVRHRASDGTTEDHSEGRGPPLDLRVLGLLVEGVTAIPALARSLGVAAQAVADSLGRSLAALRTNDRRAATVRALRGGTRIPPGATGPS